VVAASLNKARTIREVERRYILRVLEENGGNHVLAAKVLGIDCRTLYRKLEKYKL
jgi:transcriptional regulator with PAS, ATPase and Fis domain